MTTSGGGFFNRPLGRLRRKAILGTIQIEKLNRNRHFLRGKRAGQFRSQNRFAPKSLKMKIGHDDSYKGESEAESVSNAFHQYSWPGEQTLSSSSTNAPRPTRVHTCPSHSQGQSCSYFIMNNPSAFQMWQQNLHHRRVEDTNQIVQDSLAPMDDSEQHSQPRYSSFTQGSQDLEQHSQPRYSSFTQGSHCFTSDEEFQYFMNNPTFPVRGFTPLNPPANGPAFNSSTPGTAEQMLPPHITNVENADVGDAHIDGRAPAIKKKRAAKKKTPAKSKKGRKSNSSESDEDGDGEDLKAMGRWTDPEVYQLIALKGEMQEEFERNGKKQGVNTWDKLHGKMVACCENFTKTTEGCRKKWKTIFNQYANDKRLLQVSGEGRKINCKFFEEIDQSWSNRANVKKLVHGDARGTPNPCPIDLTEDEDGQGSGDGQISGGGDGGDAEGTGSAEGVEGGGEGHGSATKPNTSGKPVNSGQSKKLVKKGNSDLIVGFIGEMVAAANKIADEQSKTTNIMDELRKDLGALIQKM